MGWIYRLPMSAKIKEETQKRQNECFLISSAAWFLGFLSCFSPVTLATFIFRVNKDAEENCVYLQIIPKTEHTSTLHFAAEILPLMQIRVAHMPERRGEPSWYDCFRKLTHQEKENKKGTFRKAVAYIHRFLTLISDRFYSKQPLSSKNDDPSMDAIPFHNSLKQ